MGLRTEIWVQAYVRRAFAEGAAAYVARRGDADAGAILIIVSCGAGACLYTPAPAAGGADERRWIERTREAADATGAIAAAVGREASFDPDLWVIEIGDRDGRHFLGEALEPG